MRLSPPKLECYQMAQRVASFFAIILMCAFLSGCFFEASGRLHSAGDELPPHIYNGMILEGRYAEYADHYFDIYKRNNQIHFTYNYTGLEQTDRVDAVVDTGRTVARGRLLLIYFTNDEGRRFYIPIVYYDRNRIGAIGGSSGGSTVYSSYQSLINAVLSRDVTYFTYVGRR